MRAHRVVALVTAAVLVATASVGQRDTARAVDAMPTLALASTAQGTSAEASPGMTGVSSLASTDLLERARGAPDAAPPASPVKKVSEAAPGLSPASAINGGSYNHRWSRRFGDAADQVGLSVAADVAGNVVLTGYFYGTVDFGGGPLTSAGGDDIFVAKFDAAGNHLWSRRFGDADQQWGSAVAVDAAGDIVLTGSFYGTVDFGGGPLTSAGGSDTFVVEFDAAGNHLWSERFGDASLQYGQYGTSVAVDAAGNVVLTGYFYGTVDIGGGPLTSAGGEDIFVARFDAAGNHLWSQRFGDAADQIGTSVAVDAAGNFVLAGYFYGAVDFGGGPLTSAGNDDIFVAKFDAAGNRLWSQRFGDGDYQQARGVAVDAAGNVVLTGFLFGTVDFGGGPLTSAGYGDDMFVAKFDAAGSHLWSQPFGDSYHQNGMSVAVDAAGNVVITGYFGVTVDFGGGPLTSAGNDDIFVASFDAAGNHLWSQRFGDGNYQFGSSVAVDGAGDVVLTGYFYGTLDFGGGPLASIGGYDAFITKLGRDTDGDGCIDVNEPFLNPPTDPHDPWDFYSVPVPALIAAPNPLIVFRDSSVSAGDAQAVFAYFKAGAKAGKTVYDQDLNLNDIPDGREYDRSVLGPGRSGPPDGTVAATDAQLAFAQFKAGYHC